MPEPKYTIAEGAAHFPFFNRPNLRYGPVGTYSVRLLVSPENAGQVIAAIDKERESIYQEKRRNALPALAKRIVLADPPYELTDAGAYSLHIKELAERRTRGGKVTRFKPVILDAAGKPAPRLKIGEGSILRVSFEISRYFTLAVGAGVSLRLRAVQVLKAVAPLTPKNPAYFGFEDDTPKAPPVNRLAEFGFSPALCQH